MSAEVGLSRTSNNLAVIKTSDDISIQCIRSSIDSAKKAVGEKN